MASDRERLRRDCDTIVRNSITAVLPDAAVERALRGREFGNGRLLLVAIGKAAYSMAAAAVRVLGDRIDEGIVITKYGHAEGQLPRVNLFEAGHPVPDDNSYNATEAALKLVQGLSPQDTVLLLLSGGGSALFEKPCIPIKQVERLNMELLSCGAGIVEINTVRKHLSMVKGGRFALHCMPAKIFAVVLSDIIGDPLDMIASGPAYPDTTTVSDALAIIRKYKITLTDEMRNALRNETPKELSNVETVVTGSVRQLCKAASQVCEGPGYETVILTDSLDCEAREAGSFLAAIARNQSDRQKQVAIIAGGETVVHLKGSGKGGRNQELALSAARGIAGLETVCIFSFGSDGTDGPTDAAGGYVDGETAGDLMRIGYSLDDVLENNDAYTALKAVGGLIMTGATGTNVNDLSVILVHYDALLGDTKNNK